MVFEGRGLARRAVRGVTVFAVVALPLLPAPAAAQGGEGFLFRRPVVSVGLRGGYALASAGSEIFDFTREQLTVDKSDFNAGTVGFDVAVRLHERVDLAFNLSISRTETASEFRDWVDQDDLPIQQVTRFKRMPFTAGLRFYLRDRGRSIGRFAWIPEAWNAYAGAAGGWVWYDFEQTGDFVDFETLDIFADRFFDDGNTPTLHLFGGAEYTLNPTFVLSVEGRYQWANVEMGRDFVDFDRMDLAGFVATVGISARF